MQLYAIYNYTQYKETYTSAIPKYFFEGIWEILHNEWFSDLYGNNNNNNNRFMAFNPG